MSSSSSAEAFAATKTSNKKTPPSSSPLPPTSSSNNNNNNNNNGNNNNDNDSQSPTQYYHDYVKTLPSLQGKTVAITGCSRGLGYVTALTVAQKGGRVLLLNRKTNNQGWFHELCKEATGPKPVHIECDLLSFDSVKKASQQIMDITSENGDGLDVLCCNAGIMLQPDEASKDGYDITASTNMLSHFLLVKQLFEPLKNCKNKKARVVMMSSMSGYNGPAFDRTYFERNGGKLGGQAKSYERYHQTKLANLAFTCALQEKLEQAGIRQVEAVACTPGICGTDMFTHATSVMSKTGQPSPLSMVPSVEDGSMAQLKCIFDPTVQPGDLWGPSASRDGELINTPMVPPQILVDEETKSAVWDVCEDAVGKFEII